MSTTDKLTDVLKNAKPEDLTAYFGDPRVSIDMVMGLKNGFLT